MSELLSAVSRRLSLGSEGHRSICVAWSAGLDSTVLLDLLVRLRRRRELEVAAVHVDHGLRDGSAADAEFCRRTAQEWGVPLIVRCLRVADDGSKQHQARIQRYASIADAADRLGCDSVVTAHHADDAIETALLQFVRGTGSGGLASLAPNARPGSPIATWGTLELQRPLVSTPRCRLESYAEEADLDWRRDPTNLEPVYARNRLRQRVLPALREEAGADEPMLRTLDNLAAEDRSLQQRIDQLLDRADFRRTAHDTVALDTAALAEADDAELAGLLERATEILPRAVRWTAERLRRAVESIRRVGRTDRRVGDRMTLGGAVIFVEPECTKLVLERSRGSRRVDSRRAQPVEFETVGRGESPWFDHRVAWRIDSHASADGFPLESECAWFDAGELPERLVLRGPVPGDRLDALGLSGSTGVRDVLSDASVPESLRWRWPCLALPTDGAESGEVLWVCGLRQSERARIRETTDRRLEVQLEALRPASSHLAPEKTNG